MAERKKSRRRQAISERVNFYEDREDLGARGAGEARRVRDRRDDRTYVVVRMDAEAVGNSKGRRLFKRHLRLAQALEHPALVRVRDGGTDDGEGRPFLVAEDAGGRTLRRALESEGALAPEDALRVAVDLLNGLAHAHHRGVPEGGISPDTVLIVEDEAGRLRGRLLEYGFTRVAGPAHATPFGPLRADPDYAAPEVIKGEPAGAPADVYSVGLVLYEMLTGKHAVPAPAKNRVLHRLNETAHDLPQGTLPDGERDAAVRRGLKRALAKDPRRRFADPRAFARALAGEEVSEDASPPAALGEAGACAGCEASVPALADAEWSRRASDLPFACGVCGGRFCGKEHWEPRSASCRKCSDEAPAPPSDPAPADVVLADAAPEPPAASEGPPAPEAGEPEAGEPEAEAEAPAARSNGRSTRRHSASERMQALRELVTSSRTGRPEEGASDDEGADDRSAAPPAPQPAAAAGAEAAPKPAAETTPEPAAETPPAAAAGTKPERVAGTKPEPEAGPKPERAAAAAPRRAETDAEEVADLQLAAWAQEKERQEQARARIRETRQHRRPAASEERPARSSGRRMAAVGGEEPPLLHQDPRALRAALVVACLLIVALAWAWQADKRGLRAQIADLERERERAKASVTRGEDKVVRRERRIESLQAEGKALQDALAKVKATLTAAREGATATEADLATTREELAGAREALAAARQELDRAREEVEAAQAERDEVGADLAAARTALEAARIEAAATASELESARSAYEAERARVATLVQLVEERDAELVAAQARLASLAAELERAEAARDAAERVRAGLAADVEELERALEQARREQVRQREDLARLEEARVELARRVEELQATDVEGGAAGAVEVSLGAPARRVGGTWPVAERALLEAELEDLRPLLEAGAEGAAVLALRLEPSVAEGLSAADLRVRVRRVAGDGGAGEGGLFLAAAAAGGAPLRFWLSPAVAQALLEGEGPRLAFVVEPAPGPGLDPVEVLGASLVSTPLEGDAALRLEELRRRR